MVVVMETNRLSAAEIPARHALDAILDIDHLWGFAALARIREDWVALAFPRLGTDDDTFIAGDAALCIPDNSEIGIHLGIDLEIHQRHSRTRFPR